MSQIRTVGIKFLALFTAGVIAFAVACGGDDSASDTGAAAPAAPAATQAPAAPKAAPTKAAVAAPAPPKAPSGGGFKAAAPVASSGGQLVVGVTQVDPPIFLPSESAFSSAVFNATNGIFESLVRTEMIAPPALGERSSEGIATGWSWDKVGEKITWTIRPGVKFHDGSELTAEDVAYSMNDAIREGSKFGRAGELTKYIDHYEAVNATTAVLHLKSGQTGGNWWQAQANTNGNFVPMISKAVSEKLGRAKAVTSMIATGPFKVRTWKGGEELIADAVDTHWRQTPTIGSIRYVELPEEAVARAAYATGEIHVVKPSLKFIQETLDSVPGSRTQQLDRGTGQSIIFGGNYWADKWMDKEGQPTIFPRKGFKPDRQHPWIGDPRNAQHMRNANKVRLALTMAIDRELVNDVAIGGLGAPAYTNSGFYPGDPGWRDEWKVDHDPEKAKKLLDEAGYGGCFDITLQIAPDLPALITPEVGQVVAQLWQQIGCEVKIQQLAYGANRPLLVAREFEYTWLMQSESYGFLYDSKWHSMLPSVGFNYGIELPNDISRGAYANVSELDQDKRIATSAVIEHFVSTKRLIAPILQRILFTVVSPEVKEWNPQFGGRFNSPETVVLK